MKPHERKVLEKYLRYYGVSAVTGELAKLVRKAADTTYKENTGAIIHTHVLTLENAAAEMANGSLVRIFKGINLKA